MISHKLLAVLALGCAGALAQDIPESAWVSMTAQIRAGCIEKQHTSSATDALKPEVIDAACDCMSKRIGSKAKASPSFVGAITRMDHAAIDKQIESVGGLKFEVQHLTLCKVLRWKNNEQRTSNSGLRNEW
jgi:hypothetical protein